MRSLSTVLYLYDREILKSARFVGDQPYYFLYRRGLVPLMSTYTLGLPT